MGVASSGAQEVQSHVGGAVNVKDGPEEEYRAQSATCELHGGGPALNDESKKGNGRKM